MTANPIWIAAYGGPPPAAVGASAVWIAPGDGTVPSAAASYIAGYFNPVAGASPVWIAGYGGPPPAAIGATPITIVGYGGFGGAAPTNSPEALAYLARTVGGNEGGNGANIAALIDGLVSDGVWAKLDALYVLAQQNQADALLNLIGMNYSLGTVGLLRTIPFTSYVGFGPSATSCLSTNFIPSSATTPNFILNSASYGVWGYAISPGNVPYISNGNGNQAFVYTDNLFYARVNSPGSAGVSSSLSKGLLAGERADAANVYPYQNGVSAGPVASVSASVDVNPFFIGANPGFPSVGANQIFSAAFIGASLGAAGQLALYNRLRTYMTAIGVP